MRQHLGKSGKENLFSRLAITRLATSLWTACLTTVSMNIYTSEGSNDIEPNNLYSGDSIRPLKFTEFARTFAVFQVHYIHFWDFFNNAINTKYFQPCLSNSVEDSPVNSRYAKIQFLFNIADRGHNGFISKVDLVTVLKGLIGNNIRCLNMIELTDFIYIILISFLCIQNQQWEGFMSVVASVTIYCPQRGHVCNGVGFRWQH